MEFKEFENPEQADYDIKVGAKAPTFMPPTIDDELNMDDGIDLNALGDEEFSMSQVDNNNIGFAINEFGEIVRAPLPPTTGGLTEATGDLVDEPKGRSM